MTDTFVEEIPLDSLDLDVDDFNPCEESTDIVGVASLVTSRHVLATWLPAAFKKWGVKYRLVAGWEDRGRPMSSGYFDPQGVLIHHTGSTSSASRPHPALGLVTQGRSDLRGPLCQISTDYNGITSIVAAGRANHAGTAKAVAGVPAGDGNALWIGNEVDTNGTQKMPQVQYDAVVLSTAAILDHLGVKAMALHHTTSHSGKWDLGAGTGKSGVPYSISKFRADVNARLAAGPPKPQGAPVAQTPRWVGSAADQATAKAVLDSDVIVNPSDPTSKTNGFWTTRSVLSYIGRWVVEILHAVRVMKTDVKTMKDDIAAIKAALVKDPAP